MRLLATVAALLVSHAVGVSQFPCGGLGAHSLVVVSDFKHSLARILLVKGFCQRPALRRAVQPILAGSEAVGIMHHAPPHSSPSTKLTVTVSYFNKSRLADR